MCKVMVVCGDSITYSRGDSEGGWVQRLRKFIDKKKNFSYTIYNLGISGNKTSDLLKNFEFEVKNRLRKLTERIL